MTRTFHAHFNGKAIVPEGPVDLPRRRKLTVKVQAIDDLDEQGMSGEEFLRAIQKLDFSGKDRAEIEKAIQIGCERVDEDGK